MKLANTVLITGGSRGIGLEFVKQFLKLEKKPQKVIATCRDRTKTPEFCELQMEHPELIIMELDVTKYSSHADFASKVSECVGEQGLNLLINNAGIAEKPKDEESIRKLPLEDLEPQEMIEVLQVNTVSPLMIIKALLPLLKMNASRSDGCVFNSCVVNMSSISGSMGKYIGPPDLYCYRSSKAALNMLTKSLAIAYTDVGVNFLAMHPGWVKTDMGSERANLTTEESVQAMIKVFFNFKKEHSGQFMEYTGDVLPW